MTTRFPLVLNGASIEELQLGDDLFANVLIASGVAAGTYGGAAVEGVFTVDTFGRITSASNVTAQVANTNITGIITAAQLANTGVTATTYGGASSIPAITVDAQGRITSASNVAVTAGLTAGKSIALSIIFG